jgi:hypothetical protein
VNTRSSYALRAQALRRATEESVGTLVAATTVPQAATFFF